jgi:twitching motility two-component system response regulator PilH
VPKTVLVVDDDVEILQVYQDLFGSAGFEVHKAKAGWEALVALQTLRPAAVILDLCMPGMNGFDVAQEITGNCFTRRTPVIVVSALSDDNSLDWIHSLGIRHYLQKPFVPSELLGLVVSTTCGK